MNFDLSPKDKNLENLSCDCQFNATIKCEDAKNIPVGIII